MFYNWLLKNHVKKDTPFGDLARDARRDTEFPRVDDEQRILDHLKNKHACREAISTFKRAFKTYKKSQNNIRENSIEQRFKNEVKKRGGRALKFTSPGTCGVPDRIVLIPGGRTVFVELKAPGEKLEPLQQKRAQELRSLGYQVYCLDSNAAIDRFVAEVFSE